VWPSAAATFALMAVRLCHWTFKIDQLIIDFGGDHIMKTSILALLLTCTLCAPSLAQVYVSGATGVTQPACGSRQTPCASLYLAVNVVSPGGTIIILDPAYETSTVNINKSVSIVGPDFFANAEMPALDIAPGQGNVVVLDGFTVTTYRAVDANGGNSIIVRNGDVTFRNCTITNGGTGLYVLGGNVAISNCTFARNRLSIAVANPVGPPAASANLYLHNVNIETGLFAVNADGNAQVYISNSRIANISDKVFTAGGGGQIVSFGNNVVAGNSRISSAPTRTVPLQ
jgi:hypothetical protein